MHGLEGFEPLRGVSATHANQAPHLKLLYRHESHVQYPSTAIIEYIKDAAHRWVTNSQAILAPQQLIIFIIHT